MVKSNNGKIKSAEFQARVLTHLEYIKENQVNQEVKIDKLNDKMDVRVDKCSKRFNDVEKDVDSAKGFAKGAAWMGGTGVLASIGNFIFRYIPK